MCFNEISVHPIIIHQIVLLARVLYKRNPTATCMRDLFLNTFTFKGGEHWYWKSQYFIVLHFNCKHNSFLTWFDATLVSEVTIHRPNVSTFLSSAKRCNKRSFYMIAHLVAVWTLIYNSFLFYSELFQISQIFENVYRKLPDSVVLQPSNKKDRIILQINVFISSSCYAISGGGGVRNS